MLTIGEFAHSTMLSIKTIRYYQELGILFPASVDPVTGYRYYDQRGYERAKSIQLLKELGFTLNEVSQILSECHDEEELFRFIEEKLKDVERKIQNLKRMKDQLIRQKRTSLPRLPQDRGIIEFDFELPCYVSEKIYGTYEQIGDTFLSLYKNYGRFAIGKPYTFYSELGYTEEKTDLQGVIELEPNGSLKTGCGEHYPKTKAIKMIHEGPYGTQGSTYFQLFTYCRDHDLKIKLPVIEHFIKGPGMIFRGDPEKYKTECILLIED